MVLARFYRDHQPLFKHILLAEWLLLFAAIFMTSLALPFRYQTAHHLLSSLLFLSIMALFSPTFPDRPRDRLWKKLLCIAIDFVCVSGALLFGIAIFITPLYLVVLCKICLLFEGWMRAILIGLCFLAELSVQCFRLQLLQTLGKDALPLTVVVCALITNIGNLALMCVVTAFMFALISEQAMRRKTEQLTSELERLAADVERTRIAREMHDTLGHTLTSLKLQLEVARRFEDVDRLRAQDAMAAAEQLAARSLCDVRVALRSIRQPEFDFQEAVGELVKDAQSTGSLQVEAELEQAQLPRTIGYQLFRVVQECMTNTLKHAGASRVVIRATKNGGTLRLTFADDGQGLVGGARSDSYGIKGMHERVESIKGTLAIASKEGGGTEVTVEVPLAPGQS